MLHELFITLCTSITSTMNPFTFIIENAVRNGSKCLKFQHTKLKDKLIPYEVPGKTWEVLWSRPSQH